MKGVFSEIDERRRSADNRIGQGENSTTWKIQEVTDEEDNRSTKTKGGQCRVVVA